MPARRRYPVPKGLKPVRKRLASGDVRLYWYHRGTGRRLHCDPTTAEGFLEVARLDEAAKTAEAASAALTGSYAALWLKYRAGAAWQDLKPRTRSDYQAVRDWLGTAADTPVAAFRREDLIRLRDKARFEKGRRFANYVIQVIRLTLQWGRERGMCKENVAAGIKMLQKPRGEPQVNRAWSQAEVEAFLTSAPRQLAVPFVLALCAGMRQGDALRVTWSGYDGRALRWTAGKNERAITAPATGICKAILDDARTRRGDALQIAVNLAGSPWSPSGFRASFFKRLRELKRAGSVQPGLTFHGLRHTIGAIGRESGFSESQVAEAIGDKSPAMAALYGRDADGVDARRQILGVVGKRFANIEWKPRT